MNNKIWLVAAGIVSVGVLLMGWFLGVSPQLDEMNSAAAQKESVIAQNAAIQASIDTLRQESEQIDELKQELTDMQIALPPGDELSTFLGQLHDLEDLSGVVLTSFSASDGEAFQPIENGTGSIVSPLVTPENLIVITIDLKVEGTRAQVLDFVSALQQGERLFLVNSLTVQSSGVVDSIYNGNLTGFVYVLVDPSAPPPAPTPVGSLDSSPSPSATPEG